MVQRSTFPVQGGDLPVTNFSGSDIAAGIAVKLDTGAGNHLGVLPLTGADAGKAFAVTLDVIKAGRPGRVRRIGSVLMTADGALTAGDKVMASVDAGEEGHAKPLAAAGAEIGVAISTAADNAEVEVWLNFATNA